MDRLSQLRGEAGTSRDSTLDTSSPPSEAYMTANETSSKYFSLSEVDSTFDITPIKDVSSAVATERTITESDRLITNLSPIAKKNDFLDSYKIGKQIEAANILSGGVDIFDDNDNSYDGDELIIDDNVEGEDKSNMDMKLTDSPVQEVDSTESNLVEAAPVVTKDTKEVILLIDGKNVDAVGIGNGLYLYRRQGEDELAAVQIDDNQQQPSYKFLKVRENDMGSLEVYEEFQVEVSKEVPVQEGSSSEASVSHVPIRDVSDVTCSKVTERTKTHDETLVANNLEKDSNKDNDAKEVNGKLMKFCEARKSSVVGSFTPMTYHSTPNKEGIPLTKTMVDLQLHPNRHSDNVKKTIEVHTDSAKPKVDLLNKIAKESEDKTKVDEKKEVKVLGQSNKNIEKIDSTAENDKSDEIVNIEEITRRENKEAKKEGNQQSNESASLNKNEFSQDDEDKSIKTTLLEPALVLSKPPTKQVALEIPVSNKLNEVNLEMIVITDDKKPVLELSTKQQAPEIIEKIDPVASDTVVKISEQPTKQQASKNCATEDLIEKDSKKTNTTKQQAPEIIEKIDPVASDTVVKIPEQPTKQQVSINCATEELTEKDSKKTTTTDDTNKISELPTKQQTTKNVANEKTNDNGSERGVSTNNTNQISEDIESRKIETVNKEKIASSVNNTLETEVVASTIQNKDVCDNTIKKSVSNTIKKDSEIADINQAAGVIAGADVKEFVKNNDLNKSFNVYPDTAESKRKSENTTEMKEEENNLKVKKDASVASKLFKVENENKAAEENKEKSPVKADVPTINKDTDSKWYSQNENSTKSLDVKKNTLENKVNIDDKSKLLPISAKPSADSTNTKNVETKVSSKMDPQVALAFVADNIKKKETINKGLKSALVQNVTQNKDSTTAIKTLLKVSAITEQKPIGINHAAVPFGKWTEANRQAFLNKIKETKVPSNSSNGKQIKNSNDLNRRDVFKKIDSHRQVHTNISSAKVQDFGCSNRLPVKKEASVFTSKPATQDSKLPAKNETSLLSTNPTISKNIVKQESISKSQTDSANPIVESTAVTKKEQTHRKEINNQDLIDKTIEDIISRALPMKSQPDNGQDVMTETLEALQNNENFDEIEKRMNELHGFASIERSPISNLQQSEQKTFIKSDVQKLSCNKQSKIPNLLPYANKNLRKGVKENITDNIDSEEEVIEHEPITGDMDLNKKEATKISEIHEQLGSDNSKKEAIITENDFDKFVRRNSITYENCITVNFDGNEPVVQTVVPKDTVLRTYSKQDRLDNNKGSLKHDTMKQSTAVKPTQNASQAVEETNKNYHSKVKMAYQSAMTVKRQLERPITIIEDKPVKVVFMDSCAEFMPKHLNAQGKELSPAKKQLSSIDLCNSTTSDSLDSDILELDEGKSAETKSKTKHQRKQVLTPVETPELELIEPGDLGIQVSPKKKRKMEERIENSQKPLVPKKSYLLGRGATDEDEVTKSHDGMKTFTTEQTNVDKFDTNHISRNTASAIDNLVKAAELLETQSENLNQSSIIDPNADTPQKTPAKRGRGRPRKYPLPEGAADKSKAQTPQKKPRLSDAKVVKARDTDDDDDDSSDGEIIRENWTMGKINENIVCPICNKLFRSENVVFKHVKHCTGPSPNRSDSGNKSPRRFRESQDSEPKSVDSKLSETEIDDKDSTRKDVRKKRKSRETTLKSMSYKNESVKVEETVSKSKPEETKHVESKKSAQNKSKISDHKANNLICEFCGKTFRQLSYLVNHKLQHEKEESKNHETDIKSSKSVFSCEVCKKEFRKLHHLVQHRFIHNSSGASSAKLLRKSSAEQIEIRTSKDQDMGKQGDDTSAGFRCEPCDKSFRKLHHLVEHRETHDGINRQKNQTVSAPVEKTPPPPQCEICKKTFRKLHHLIEHKEQHLETSSEKSDDKSVKSSLSTKDIIHECSLCYMVFPNEHSLNKHTIICQRKKRQSATKQNKPSKELEQDDENKKIDKLDDDLERDNEVIIVLAESISVDKNVENLDLHTENITKEESKTDIASSAVVANIDESAESPRHEIAEKPKDLNTNVIKERKSDEVKKVTSDIPVIRKKSGDKESLKVAETPKKKADKVAPIVTKRHKPNIQLPVVDNVKSMESSDDDEVRYMFNPDYKTDENVKGKVFMNIRANKRNSLQIERPNSKDLVKRRISLQHHTKVPRLKSKLVQNKIMSTDTQPITKSLAKIEPLEPSTDSDDSDVKYSFPKTSKSKIDKRSSKESGKKLSRKSLTEKRKSLSTIAKRKSLGKTLGAKHKAKPSPMKPIKKRSPEAGHRCDCGQLFSSAALLSRHTVLAHTPPRIRRRRSPPPSPDAGRRSPSPAPDAAAKLNKSTTTKPKVSTTRKSSVSKPPTVAPKNPELRKSLKTSEPIKSGVTNTKVKRMAAHKGVPVPEKMKKLIEKFKK